MNRCSVCRIRKTELGVLGVADIRREGERYLIVAENVFPNCQRTAEMLAEKGIIDPVVEWCLSADKDDFQPERLPPEVRRRVVEKYWESEEAWKKGTLDSLRVLPLIRVPEFYVPPKEEERFLKELEDLAKRYAKYPGTYSAGMFRVRLRVAASLKREGKLPPTIEQKFREVLKDFEKVVRRRKGKLEYEQDNLDICELADEETKAKIIALLL
jgi:quinol monooxygenase YgiN